MKVRDCDEIVRVRKNNKKHEIIKRVKALKISKSAVQ